MKKRPQQKKRQPMRKGTCRICGCTDSTPCLIGFFDEPCVWADSTKTLCTNPNCLAKVRVKR
jgi:hypothetical protein